uniref:Uncharacterized protein n=1 Tax=Megaselia scalaris TaxID=36166 RepID=T1H5D8_MEGSC
MNIKFGDEDILDLLILSTHLFNKLSPPREAEHFLDSSSKESTGEIWCGYHRPSRDPMERKREDEGQNPTPMRPGRLSTKGYTCSR